MSILLYEGQIRYYRTLISNRSISYRNLIFEEGHCVVVVLHVPLVLLVAAGRHVLRQFLRVLCLLQLVKVFLDPELLSEDLLVLLVRERVKLSLVEFHPLSHDVQLGLVIVFLLADGVLEEPLRLPLGVVEQRVRQDDNLHDEQTHRIRFTVAALDVHVLLDDRLDDGLVVAPAHLLQLARLVHLEFLPLHAHVDGLVPEFTRCDHIRHCLLVLLLRADVLNERDDEDRDERHWPDIDLNDGSSPVVLVVVVEALLRVVQVVVSLSLGVVLLERLVGSGDHSETLLRIRLVLLGLESIRMAGLGHLAVDLGQRRPVKLLTLDAQHVVAVLHAAVQLGREANRLHSRQHRQREQRLQQLQPGAHVL
ncbi:hypothetical protein PMAYCL1PPCAC_20425, partial [Pristionchus mayeri]